METKLLKDLCFKDKIGIYGIPASAEDFSDKKPRYLRISDISDDGILLDDDKKSVSSDDIEKYFLSEGDIVFARTGNSTGRSYLYDKKDGVLAFAGFLIKFGLDPSKVNPLYVRYFTISDYYKSWINNSSVGSTRGNMSAQSFAECPIVLPSRKQQDNLVHILSSIDRLISTKRNENSTLEAMAKEIYDYWFVQFDFPNNDGKPYKSSGGKMVFNEILKREIPEGWEAGKLGDLFDSQAGFAFKSSNWTDFGHPVLTIKNICDDGSIDLSCASYIEKYDSKYERYSVNNGNMIFAMSGNTIGKIGIISSHIKNILINQRVLIIKTDLSNIAFVYFTTRDKKVQNLVLKLGANSAQPNISEEEFKNISICLPNSNIINLYNKSNSSLFEKIIKNRQQIQSLTSLRDYLLPLLMNGQVEVKEAEKKFQEIFQKMPMAAEEEAEFGR